MKLHFKAMWCNGRPKIWHNCCRREETFWSHFPQNCLRLWASAVRGIISRTRDCTVTPRGKLAPLHLTPTRIIIVDVVHLFCSTSELKSSSCKSKRLAAIFLFLSFGAVCLSVFLLSLSQKCPWYSSPKWRRGPTASCLHSCCADWVYWIWHDALNGDEGGVITEAANHDVGIPQVPAVSRVQQRT